MSYSQFKLPTLYLWHKNSSPLSCRHLKSYASIHRSMDCGYKRQDCMRQYRFSDRITNDSYKRRQLCREDQRQLLSEINRYLDYEPKYLTNIYYDRNINKRSRRQNEKKSVYKLQKNNKQQGKLIVNDDCDIYKGYLQNQGQNEDRSNSNNRAMIKQNSKLYKKYDKYYSLQGKSQKYQNLKHNIHQQHKNQSNINQKQSEQQQVIQSYKQILQTNTIQTKQQHKYKYQANNKLKLTAKNRHNRSMKLSPSINIAIQISSTNNQSNQDKQYKNRILAQPNTSKFTTKMIQQMKQKSYIFNKNIQQKIDNLEPLIYCLPNTHQQHTKNNKIISLMSETKQKCIYFSHNLLKSMDKTLVKATNSPSIYLYRKHIDMTSDYT